MYHIRFGRLPIGILLGAILISGLLCTMTGSAFAGKTSSEKNILILNSYTPDNIWTKGEELGFQKKMGEVRQDVVYYHEYMGTKKFSDEAYYRAFGDMLKIKYAKTEIDCVFTTDDDATAFMAKYRERIFGRSVPVIYCGVNSLVAMPSDFWGIQEKTSIVALIQLIRQIHGATKPVVIFTDQTSSSSSTLNDLYNRTDAAFRENITIIREDRVASARSKLQQLKDCTVVFLLFNRDAEGKSYTYLEGYELFQRDIKVPTYSTWDFYLGEGIVGGIFTSSSEQGGHAAELALTLLNSHMVVQAELMAELTGQLNNLDNQAGFDYTQLTLWQVRPEALPENSHIINEPISYFEKNKTLILISFSIIAGLIAIILYMTRIIQLKNRFQSELSSSHLELENINNHLESLVEEKVSELESSYKKLNDAEMKLLHKEKVESMLNLSLQTAHELNTPIGNSITLMSFIKEEASRVEQQLQSTTVASPKGVPIEVLSDFFTTLGESIGMVENSLNRAATYITGIKDRLTSAGTLADNQLESRCGMEDILNNLWSLFASDLTIKRHFEGPAICLADREALIMQSVLKTLISNSLQHGFAVDLEGREAEIRVIWGIYQYQLTVVYEDNGCGISPDRLRHLFTPLYKSDISKGNLPLGLYGALNQIESELKGKMTCESEPGQRTRFIISFKLESSAD